MKTKNLKITTILLMLATTFAACNKQKNNSDKEDFCLYVNVENIDRTMPFVDKFLAGLTNDLPDEQKLQALATWLKSQPCIIDATVLCQSCVKTLPLMSEISISFDENGEMKEMILDVSMSNPLKTAGYHEKEDISSNDISATIVNDNSAWAILGIVVCPECPIWTQHVYLEGDSIVADISYKKVFSCEDKLHENTKFEGLIREKNKKTYFIPANSVTEYLLYDFSLEEGMKFEYVEPLPNFEPHPVTSYVKKVDFVEINGVQKKRIQLAEDSFPYDENASTCATWIENIGSLNGLFNPCGVLAPGICRVLLCFFQNNELVYKNPEYSECYYDNEEDMDSVQTIKIKNKK